MARRTIIEIDQDLCDGCGACETGCPEGALRIIDGKARLVGESLCDGLGACIGTCPRGAIHVIEREADAYDEVAVIEEILPQGAAVLEAHFAHLDHHGQDLYIDRAVSFLKSKGIPLPRGYESWGEKKSAPAGAPLAGMGSGGEAGCKAAAKFAALGAGKPPLPGGIHAASSARMSAGRTSDARPDGAAALPGIFPSSPSGESSLKNWPIQLHLANPRSPHFEAADVVIAADCTAFALGSFHKDIIAGRSLVIACPKLDSGRDIYLSKLTSIVARANSVAVVMMEVPCCSGLLKLVQEARAASGSRKPIGALVVGIDGSFVAEKTFA